MKRLAPICIGLLVLAVAGAALADVGVTPPWFPDRRTTRRHFTFAGRTPTEDKANPFDYGYAGKFDVAPVVGQPYDHEYLLTVQNYKSTENVKKIWLQFVWEQSGPGGIADPTNAALHGSDVGAWTGGITNTEDLGGGRFRRTIEWQVDHQPGNEWFKWQTAGDWRIVQAAVATLCEPKADPAGAVRCTTAKPFGEYGKARNREVTLKDGSKTAICCAVATANSFAYLYNHYPLVYQTTDLIPDINGNGYDQADVDNVALQLATGWHTGPVARDGIYNGPDWNTDPHKSWWEHKLWWFDDHAPDTTVFDGQYGFAGDPSKWMGGDVIEPVYPQWSFLWEELEKCEDIELGIQSATPGGGAHGITLTRLCFVDSDGDGKWDPGERRKMRYLDPNGDPIEREAILSVGPGGRLEFDWWQEPFKWFLGATYTESIPEPCTLALLALAAMGALRRRRRT